MTAFFTDLGLPRPDVNLEVGFGSHATHTAEVMRGFEAVCEQRRPACVLVVGEVISTIVYALVASKLGIAIANVEAGLRSFDRSMPEEINRVLTDAISDLHFTTEESGSANLRREGASAEGIHFVGDVMVDTLLKHGDAASRLDTLSRLGLIANGVIRYGVLTLHRPANCDEPRKLQAHASC